MKRSYIIALAVLAVVALWVGSGYLFPSGKSKPGKAGRGQAAESAKQEGGPSLFRVRTAELRAVPFVQTLTLRGHTEAWRKATLKAEVDGRVEATPVEKGARVESQETICRLDPRARAQELAEAKARLKQRRLAYDAAAELAAKGHRSRTQLAEAEAELEAAEAEVKRRELALAHTRIRAPFPGTVIDRPAEVGDYLGVGGVCASVAQLDPIRVVTSVTEADVDHLNPGAEVTVRLPGGREETGRVAFIAPAADPDTRTFRVEIKVANPRRDIRDGLTASVVVPLKAVRAQRLSPSLLVLGDDGRIGVRAVDDDGRVRFYPVTILQDDAQAVWVGGLPERVEVITVGQEFVRAGEQVIAQPDPEFARSLAARGPALQPAGVRGPRADGDAQQERPAP